MIDQIANELFADGGVISVNPSTIGGTWAYRLVKNGIVVCEKSGIIRPAEAGLPAITNNLTEMLALVKGLLELPADWIGIVYSDSQITLGRVFGSYKWAGIPLWLHRMYQRARGHLIHWDQIHYIQLDGHPTRAQLAAGIGKRGHQVSIHNVACDQLCQLAAQKGSQHQ
jgi:ribonuclease HI